MNTILPAIMKGMLASGILYGYYQAFLRNRKFHRYNRFYLLFATLASFLIPFLRVPASLFGYGYNSSVLTKTLRVITIGDWEEPVIVVPGSSGWARWINWQNGAGLVYLAGVLAGLAMLVSTLVYIRRICRKYRPETFAGLQFYNTDEPGTPFTFFRSVFWNRNLAFNTKEGQQVFRHEWFHAKQNHSADILLLQLACCLGWFNPFFHLIRRELKTIHEFLADEYAVSQNDHHEYAELLLEQAIAQKQINIGHSFFHQPIKRRIAMITHHQIRRGGYLGRVMALPLLLLLCCAFALRAKPGIAAGIFSPPQTIKVIVDAGHGGADDGAISGGVKEKDLALAIAQQVKALAAGYNIDVQLTRSGDELPGNAGTREDGLRSRLDLADRTRPDLFISLHVNATGEATTTTSGFEAYVSKQRQDARSAALASAILDRLQALYTTAPAIKQPARGIYVLDNCHCPSVMIQCGYINNSKDLQFVNNPANQAAIARKILEGIVQYAAEKQKTNIAENYIPAVRDTSSPVYKKVEFEAEFPGGRDAWVQFLVKNVKYPDAALKQNIQGTVVVQFIVNKDGTLSDIRAISGPAVLTEESVRIIRESGKWLPAMQNQRKVNSYKRQPINYKLG